MIAGKFGELSDKQRERLEELKEHWQNEDFGASSSLTVADLALLLRHHPALHELIRQIVRKEDPTERQAAPRPTPQSKTNLDPTPNKAPREAEIIAEDQSPLPQELHQAQAEIANLRRELEKRDEELEQRKAEIQTAQQELKRKDDQLSKCVEAGEKTKRERDDLARQIENLRERPPLGKAGKTLAFLCGQDELLKRLSLQGLTDNVEGLVRTVAVLAQKDNVVRLLEALGEVAQSRAAPVSPEERDLIETSVAWLNHNWERKPYRLVDPLVGEKYDFTAHRRARTTPTGETIVAVLAPGLQNAAGHWEVKPIVSTK